MMERVEGCKLIDNNDVVCSDHEVRTVGITMEECFYEQLSSWDKTNKAILNLARLSRRSKRVDSIEEQLKTHNVGQDLTSIGSNPLNYEMEKVHELTTRTLNAARKKVEGMARNAPCSKEKEKRRPMALCLKAVLQMKRGIAADKGMTEKEEAYQKWRT